MGKIFSKELLQINSTFQWAQKASITDLEAFINDSSETQLLSVGSGGSLTAAHFAALLHRDMGRIACGMTPLDLIFTKSVMGDNSTLFLTAGGRNPDILYSFKYAALSEPQQLMAVCMRSQSPLAKLAHKYQYTYFSDYEIPCGKDGFLATNSLVGLMTLLIRAYQSYLPENLVLPDNILSIEGTNLNENITDGSFYNKETFLVLYGGWGYPAAVDLESKFTESGLGRIQLADYRNFAHGRHQWINIRPDETAIIALITDDETEMAHKTLNLIPPNIPVLKIYSQRSGPLSSLELVCKGFLLVHELSKIRGIDPGKPKVSIYGRKIYHLSLLSNYFKENLPKDIDNRKAISIKRKLKSSNLSNLSEFSIKQWSKSYDSFLKNIESINYGSIIFDYDGTLCQKNDRFLGPSTEIISELNRFLNSNIIVGIATGRGISVRNDLRHLIPQKNWKNVIIGYYNGSSIGSLSDDSFPNKQVPIHPAISQIEKGLLKNDRLHQFIEFESRPTQISILSTSKRNISAAKISVFEIITKMNLADEVKIVESSHSLDIIPHEISKVSLVTFIKNILLKKHLPENILCIGDKGGWPGNDFDLLSTPYSLSVDTVSQDLNSCWNLSPPGIRGLQSTLYYMAAISNSGKLSIG